jgi:hypothetical protein
MPNGKRIPFRKIFEFNIDGYLTEFDELWWLSKEETSARSLDAEAEKVGKKIKRLPVSQNLFDDLKKWRANLFKNYKAYNLIFAAQVDEAVLSLLNRLIFIRTAEDREVENNRLRALVRELKDKKQIQKLDRELHRALVKWTVSITRNYSQGIFPKSCKLRQRTWKKLLKDCTKRISRATTSMQLDADVLGTAYEQYLGSIVTEGQMKRQSSFFPAPR